MPYKDPNDPRNIAYRKAYYERTKNGRYKRIKHNTYKWREMHKDQYDSLKKEYYNDNKPEILERQKKSYQKNITKRKESSQNRIDELTDKYMISYLIKVGFTRKFIRQNPEIIDTYRRHLLLKRKLKLTKWRKIKSQI